MAEAVGHGHGFSLLEVLISLFVLSCGLLPLSAMVVSSLQQLRDSDADSRLLLAGMNLAEARQLELPASAASSPLTDSMTSALRQMVQTWWPEALSAARLCRHANPLGADALDVCPSAGRWWLQLRLSPERALLLPLE